MSVCGNEPRSARSNTFGGVSPMKRSSCPSYPSRVRSSVWGFQAGFVPLLALSIVITTEVRAAASRACAPATVVASPVGTGNYPVGRADYNLATRVRINNDNVRLWATVRYPATVAGRGTAVAAAVRGKLPLLMFLHGNHGIYRVSGEDNCSAGLGGTEVPNHLGYDYMLDDAARAGFLAISISANDLNCKNDRITERARLVHEHLALWKKIDAGTDTTTAANVFKGRVDLSNVGLFGHSRGAEAVVVAAASNPDPSIRVRGVLSLAPVDFLGRTVSNVPLLMVLPAADGDVTDNDGAKIYDRASGVAPWFKAQSYVFGANHNYFNTEWADDDGFGPNRLSPETQRRWLLGVSRTFFEITMRDRADLAGVLSGDSVLENAGVTDVYPSYVEGDALLVDDWRGSSRSVNTLGAPVTSQGFDIFRTYPFQHSSGAYNGTFFHETRGLVVAWRNAREDALLSSALPEAVADVSSFGALSFRVAQVSKDPRNADSTPLVLAVEATDADGNIARVTTDELGLTIPNAYRPEDAKTMLRTVRVPLSCFARGSAPPALGRFAQVSLSVPSRRQGALAYETLHFAH
jgi:dienelactone hydrolase